MQLWFRRFLVRRAPEAGDMRFIERYFINRTSTDCSVVESKDDAEFSLLQLNYPQYDAPSSSSSSSKCSSVECIQSSLDHKSYAEKRDASSYGVIFESFFLSKNIELRKYHNEHGGFQCIECTFDSFEQAESFDPPSFCGKEITHTLLGTDLSLVRLSEEELTHMIDSL